jgi:hypothetical protein
VKKEKQKSKNKNECHWTMRPLALEVPRRYRQATKRSKGNTLRAEE